MPKNIATYGIIGFPVKHSRSAIMHNTAFKALGVPAQYQLFELKEDDLASFFKGLKDSQSPVFGLNVTIPYKEKALEYMDSLSPFARKVMSVNTIVINENRQMTGYNTDGPGFLAHLAELKFSLAGKRVAILGAGGTTRSILGSLCLIPERPESIRLYNRTMEKALELKRNLSAQIDVSPLEIVGSIDDLNIELADLVINTTSVGLGDPKACLISPEQLHANMLVYDVIYDPQETRLLSYAKEAGAQTANGLGMLFYQGMLSFQHWANQELPFEIKTKIRQLLERGAENA